jgi:hypothetical protein
MRDFHLKPGATEVGLIASSSASRRTRTASWRAARILSPQFRPVVAGKNPAAVDQHCAGSALPVVAALLGARELQLFVRASSRLARGSRASCTDFPSTEGGVEIRPALCGEGPDARHRAGGYARPRGCHRDDRKAGQGDFQEISVASAGGVSESSAGEIDSQSPRPLTPDIPLDSQPPSRSARKGGRLARTSPESAARRRARLGALQFLYC